MKLGLKCAFVGAALVLSAPTMAQTVGDSQGAMSNYSVTVSATEVASIVASVRAVIAQYGATASTLQLQSAITAAIPAGSDSAAVGLALNTVAGEFAASTTIANALTAVAVQAGALPVLSTLPAGAVVVGGLVILGGVVVGVQALDDDSDY